jgi:hypothetical protein
VTPLPLPPTTPRAVHPWASTTAASTACSTSRCVRRVGEFASHSRAQCADKCGVFVRADAVRRVLEPRRMPRAAVTPAAMTTNARTALAVPTAHNVKAAAPVSKPTQSASATCSTTDAQPPLVVGMSVRLKARAERAVVRFIGTAKFETGVQVCVVARCIMCNHGMTGEWVGIELPRATGRNDGSVNGVRYFQCEAHHG